MTADPYTVLDGWDADHAEDHPYCTGCPLTRAAAAIRAVLDEIATWEAVGPVDPAVWHIKRALTDALTNGAHDGE